MDVMRNKVSRASRASGDRFDRYMRDVRRVSLGGDKSELATIISNIGRIQKYSSLYNEEQICLLLCETAHCLEQFDMLEEALHLAKRAVDVCVENGQVTWFLRKAHNTVAVCQMRLCNFTSAVFHLNKSLELAIALNDDVARLSAMANAVALLDAMDLNGEALELSIRIRTEQASGPALTAIKFQNAVNGGKLAIGACNPSALQLFVDDGIACVRSSAALADVHLVQHYANKSVLRAWKGDERRSLTVLRRLFKRALRLKNNQINSILIWGMAICAADSNDKKELTFTRSLVRQMMKLYASSSFSYEDLVLALLPLYQRLPPRRKNRIQSCLAERLKRYHIATKHAQFFARPTFLPVEFSAHVSGTLQNPVYDWPRPLWAPLGEGRNTTDVYARNVGVEQDMPAARFLCLRTERFDIAENWAVAAEWAAGIRGGFCFKVGRTAALLAKSIGWAPEKCVSLELACRLHDVGSVVVEPRVAKAVADGALDSDCIGREHTWAGYHLLAGTDDGLLSLAARIALAHREWFNGCGYPQGLQGDSICIEARLCSVAREYCALIEMFGKIKDGRLRALHQCRAMAGVQLDPSLVRALVEIAESSSPIGIEPSCDSEILCNKLFRAKLRLSETLLNTLPGVLSSSP